nr:immunoglobulin heavy chain junction region [Mus musculus]MBK4187011.1 immunoglobulin heavy chain junction region [Mus musculus]
CARDYYGSSPLDFW